MKCTLPCSLATAVLAAFLLASCGGSEKPTPDDSTTTPPASTEKVTEVGKKASGQEEQAMEQGKAMAKDHADAVVSEAKAAAAEQLFTTYCSTCHGTSGHGDGPAAAALEPKPASFADAAWQDSVTDEHLLKVIREGGAAAGKSPLMVAAPGAKDDPELAQALLNIVRSYHP